MSAPQWFETPGDVLNLEIPPRRWLLDPVLPTEGLVLLAAPPKTAKTTLALQVSEWLGVDHQAGHGFDQHAGWWEGVRRPGPAGPVVWLQADATLRDWHTQLSMMQLQPAALVRTALLPAHWLADLSIREAVHTRLVEWAPHLTVVDSFDMAAPSTSNLNERQGVMAALSLIESLIPAGTPWLLLHHLRKPPQGGDVRWAAPSGYHGLVARASVIWSLARHAHGVALTVEGRGVGTPLAWTGSLGGPASQHRVTLRRVDP